MSLTGFQRRRRAEEERQRHQKDLTQEVEQSKQEPKKTRVKKNDKKSD